MPGALIGVVSSVKRSRVENKNKKYSYFFYLLDDERYEISKKRVRAPKNSSKVGVITILNKLIKVTS